MAICQNVLIFQFFKPRGAVFSTERRLLTVINTERRSFLTWCVTELLHSQPCTDKKSHWSVFVCNKKSKYLTYIVWISNMDNFIFCRQNFYSCSYVFCGKKANTWILVENTHAKLCISSSSSCSYKIPGISESVSCKYAKRRNTILKFTQ